MLSRNGQFMKKPPIPEQEFLKVAPNHGELTSKLTAIGTPVPDIFEYAKYVCRCWFSLAEEHLDEANKALAANCTRAVFSRAYYAVYNASKAARYIVRGGVSLKGDDHAKASTDLPQDLPNVDHWSQQITELYEHRLRADYDNWADTATSNSLTPANTVANATAFVTEARNYINTKFGAFL
jgi:uncharacterized protein (UPF0332 family)